MANFASPGASFSRGFSEGRNRRMNKQLMEQQAQQEQARRVAESIKESATSTEATQTQFRQAAVRLAEKGLTPESPEFQQLAEAAMASAMAHAQSLRMIGAEEQAMQYVRQQQQLFDASYAGVSPTDEAFETIRGEDVAPELAGAIMQKGPDGKITMLFDPEKAQTESESALAARVRILGEAGIPEGVAKKIAGGAYRTTVDPVTREAQVIDISTGELIFQSSGKPQVPESSPLLPENVDVSEAVGAQGAISNVANIVRDSFGLGLQNPKAQEATDALETVGALTKLLLQAEVPGRPAADIREELAKLTVKPNSFLQGEERAASNLRQTLQIIESNLTQKETLLEGPLSPTDRAQLISNVSQLRQLKTAYDDMLSGFRGGDSKQPALDAFDAAMEAGNLDKADAIMNAIESGDQEALRKLLDGGN